MYSAKISIKKGDKCPICHQNIIPPNTWVKYHIAYKPEITVLACKYCNYTEYCLRNEIRGSRAMTKKRINKVINFHKKFNIMI